MIREQHRANRFGALVLSLDYRRIDRQHTFAVSRKEEQLGGRIKRTADGDPMMPANVTYPPSMIATAIEMTAVGMTSNAPVSGTFTIGSVLVTPDNAMDFYFPDSPF